MHKIWYLYTLIRLSYVYYSKIAQDNNIFIMSKKIFGYLNDQSSTFSSPNMEFLAKDKYFFLSPGQCIFVLEGVQEMTPISPSCHCLGPLCK